jgi:membrane associated rhomboid family serine protease
VLPIRDRLPTRRPPIVNWILIALNVGAFVWMQALLSVAGPRGANVRAHELLLQWGLVPTLIVQHPVEALFLPLWFIFGLFLELPAWLLILQYLVVNLISGLSSLGGQGGGVAFFAHLGGFAAGILFVRLFYEEAPRQYEPWSQFRSRPRPPSTSASRRNRGDPWSW